MRLGANNPIWLGALDDALRDTQEPSLDLFSKIINSACTRVQARGQALTHIVRLGEIGAWTEATFALIALELPLWTVRRLAFENGEWLCSLSRQPNLPMTFDDCAEASHEVLPLAMLCAFVKRAADAMFHDTNSHRESLRNVTPELCLERPAGTIPLFASRKRRYSCPSVAIGLSKN